MCRPVFRRAPKGLQACTCQGLHRACTALNTGYTPCTANTCICTCYTQRVYRLVYAYVHVYACIGGIRVCTYRVCRPYTRISRYSHIWACTRMCRPVFRRAPNDMQACTCQGLYRVCIPYMPCIPLYTPYVQPCIQPVYTVHSPYTVYTG